MSEFHDPFIPHQVDESIEQITSISQPDAYVAEQINADTRLIHNLQRYYAPERQRYLHGLQRVENRLLEQLAPDHEELPKVYTSPSQQQQAVIWWRKQRKGRDKQMKEQRQSTSRLVSLTRNASILVIILLLVGSLALVFMYVRQRSPGTGGQPISPPPTATMQGPPTATPTPESIGTTLYTTSANAFGSNGISWSPDSKRVASSTINGVQIWDATGGQHLVNIQLPGANEAPYGLSWSPTSQMLAIATNQEVVLVNGQNGQIIRKHDTTVTAIIKPVVPGSSYLGDHFSESGGLGFRAVTWSPDGKFIASALSFGPSGEILVWNAENNVTQFTIGVGNGYNISALAWSSDGQYLAASTWNTQGGDPTQPNNEVIVWKVSTQKVIFRHKDSLNNDGPIFWQPQSHNLSFNGQISSGPAIEIWDVLTGMQVKRYENISSYGLGWSPDGKYFAYANNIGGSGQHNVTIIDANTEKLIYIYKEHKNNINSIVWSPNGKYIVSAEGNAQGAMLVKVWVAE